MCDRLVLRYIGNSGVDVDCSYAATLNYHRMLGEVYFIVFAVLQYLVRGL